MMSTVRAAKRGSKRRAQAGNGDNVVVNLDVSPPLAGSNNGSSIPGSAPSSQERNNELGSLSSLPIDVEALEDDEVQAVSPSRVPPQRRSRTSRREPMIVALDDFLGLHPRQEGMTGAATATISSVSNGNKRRRFPPVVHCISPDREDGSTLQPNNVVKINTEPAKRALEEPTFNCPVCLNKLDEPSSTICGHIFCEKCIKASIQAQKKCPTCRRKLRMNNFHRIYFPNAAG